MTSEASISVIVVEDEPDLLEEVATFLSARGLSVRAAADGDAFWREFDEQAPDVVVLDLGLPGEDGVTIAATLRQRAPTVGIVMMTARGGVQDRIAGYEIGASIYLVKPVDLGELLAAVRAILRQRNPDAAAGQRDATGWCLDLTGWRLIAPDGRPVQLTRAETQLLDCLTQDPGTPVSRIAIGSRMGKVTDLSDHRYVDQVIWRLRRKIEGHLDIEAPIGSAHSQGYYFTQAVERFSS